MEEIHDRIKRFRDGIKLSQKEFGEKIGLSQSAFSGIETGRDKLLPKNFELICFKFGINEEWLRTGKGDMLKNNFTIYDKDGNILSFEEIRLIDLYRKLTETNKMIATKQMEILFEIQSVDCISNSNAV